jgi:LPXTG-site transpeptidase (sortase) family protein
MVSSRKRPGVFLLAIATMMFSLVLLSATSSGAQTETENQNNNAKVAVGDDECVEFENENTATDATNQDTATNNSETSGDISTVANEDNATDGNTPGENSTDGNANAADANADPDRDTEPDTATGTTNQDVGADNEDAETSTNGEDLTPSQDEGDGTEDDTNSQDDGNGSDPTTSSQDEGAEDQECVVADTVPDKSLLPTGATVSGSRTDEKARKKNDPDGQQESRKRTTQQETTNGEARKKFNDIGKQQKATSNSTQKKASNGTQKKVNSDSWKKSSRGVQKKTTGGEALRKPNTSATQSNSGSGETTQEKSNRSEAQSNSGSGGTVAVRGREVEVDDRAGKEPSQEDLKARARSAAASDLAPRLAATKWARPSREEVVSTSKPRNFAPDPNAGMTLSARALGLYDMPVTSSNRREDLDNSLVHVPETSHPWDEGDQKNVFIAGHYLGTPQTPSRLAFYNLHKLKSGDELVLEDGRGQAYKYRVSEKFAVGPGDAWAMGEVRDRDMVTLQTCIPPDFGKRLMVRADRVRT